MADIYKRSGVDLVRFTFVRNNTNITTPIEFHTYNMVFANMYYTANNDNNPILLSTNDSYFMPNIPSSLPDPYNINMSLRGRKRDFYKIIQIFIKDNVNSSTWDFNQFPNLNSLIMDSCQYTSYIDVSMCEDIEVVYIGSVGHGLNNYFQGILFPLHTGRFKLRELTIDVPIPQATINTIIQSLATYTNATNGILYSTTKGSNNTTINNARNVLISRGWNVDA